MLFRSIIFEIQKAANLYKPLQVDMYKSAITGDYRFIARFIPEDKQFNKDNFQEKLQGSLKDIFIIYGGKADFINIKRVKGTNEFEVTIDVKVCTSYRLASLANFIQMQQGIN